MNSEKLYDDEELKEIESFLRGSYIKLAASHPSAGRRNPDKAVEPEVSRLKQKVKQPLQSKFGDKDMDEFLEAANSPFAKDFKNVKQDFLTQSVAALPPNLQSNSANKERHLGALLLRNLINNINNDIRNAGPLQIAISSASLAAMMQVAGIPLVFAPMIVWIATKAYKIGLPALCETIDQYLRSIGV